MELSSLVDGEWVRGFGPERDDVNPARPDEVLATTRDLDLATVDRAGAAAGAAAPGWRRTPFHERAAVLARAAVALAADAEPLGRELSREEGKTLPEAQGEVRRAARILEFFAAEADRPTGESFASPRPGERIATLRVPVGPTAILTPWNFPIAIPTWKLAPALVYGNPVILKPSPVTPILAVRLVEALVAAGLPDGVLQLVHGGADVATRLLDHLAIRACSFTGSTPTGRSVLAAGAQRGVAVQAEMGGVNPAVVLADADLDLAAAAIVAGATGSTGQKCTATSRLIVDRRVADELLDRIVAGCRDLVVGDPLDPDTDLGPVATPGQLDEVARALGAVRDAGGEVVLDGKPVSDPDQGWFVGPSVVTGVEATHEVHTEEVFGPLLAVTEVSGSDEAFAAADAGAFGLVASVFTTDLGAALAATEQLEVGIVHVNSETTGAEPHVPFGGVKASGAGGREQGRAAREFFTETRTVYLS